VEAELAHVDLAVRVLVAAAGHKVVVEAEYRLVAAVGRKLVVVVERTLVAAFGCTPLAVVGHTLAVGVVRTLLVEVDHRYIAEFVVAPSVAVLAALQSSTLRHLRQTVAAQH